MPIHFSPIKTLSHQQHQSQSSSLLREISGFSFSFAIAFLLPLFQMFGSGEKSSKEFCSSYHHLHDQRKEVIAKKLPKGCLAIKVGRGEKQQRIVVPVLYLNHPLFAQLLKEAEEEYGFEYHEGAITIPCHVDEFWCIQGTIEKEKSLYHHHHHHHHNLGCFRVL